MKKEVTIIGAGLVGSLLAVYLLKRGYKVTIYDRREDMRKAKLIAGRSINLALSDRGIKALEEVGLMEEVRKIAIPMHGRKMHNADGSEAYQAYGKDGQFINSVSRGALNCMLMNATEELGAKIIFNHKCENIDWSKNEISFTNGDKKLSIIHFQLLFGADGSYSATRLVHQLQHDRFQYNQFYIDYGYKELHIPAGKKGEFLLEKNALHIWPRGKYMMIALPNTDGSFTCTLFFPFNGDPSFDTLDTKDNVQQFFENNFADATKLMPDLAETFFSNPTASLVTVKCFPWIREDKFALIGDASHAIVPFFGQGMNAGFEDCSVLNSLIGKHNDDWYKINSEFQDLRKPDADAIADLALANFIEMRDKVTDPQFLLQKKIEASFNTKHPDKWIPAYSMVTFSPEIRYSDALKKGNMQQTIMDEIMAVDKIEENWQGEEIEKMILKKLKERNV